MRAYIEKNLVTVVTVLAGLVVVSVVLVGVLFFQVARTDDRLAQAERDLVSTQDRLSNLLITAATFTGQINDLQPAVAGALADAVTGLDEFATSTIEVNVPIDQTIPVDTEFVFNRTIDVPIQTVVPIDQTVDTTITVQGPLGVEIPVDVSVPVVLDLPVDVTFPLTVDETIPISTSIPVRLDVPISIDVAGTELAELATSLRDGLMALDEALGDLGG